MAQTAVKNCCNSSDKKHEMDLSKSHGYNTRNKAYLNHPHAKNTSYSKNFLARGLKAYNELPIKILASKNTGTFSVCSKHRLLTKDTSS